MKNRLKRQAIEVTLIGYRQVLAQTRALQRLQQEEKERLEKEKKWWQCCC